MNPPHGVPLPIQRSDALDGDADRRDPDRRNEATASTPAQAGALIAPSAVGLAATARAEVDPDFEDGSTGEKDGFGLAAPAGMAEATPTWGRALGRALVGGRSLPGSEASAVTLHDPAARRAASGPADAREAPRRDLSLSEPGLGVADLDADPPDPTLFEGRAQPMLWMRLRVIPWREIAGQIVWATDGTLALGVMARRLGLSPPDALFVEVAPEALDRAFARRFDGVLAAVSTHRLPEGESVRGLVSMRVVAAVMLSGFLVALTLQAGLVLPALIALVLGLNLLTTGFRLGALIAGWRATGTAPPPPRAAGESEAEARAAAEAALPMVSLLVPLYREAGMVDHVLDAITALDYPADRIETKLVVEADDAPTRSALSARVLPAGVTMLIVPPGRPRTKPRALNYALSFCRGAVIGILDAEDRPERGQLRAVTSAFAALPSGYGCVQCQLSFHNARENWVSRCFQIEYSIWFDVLLRGWERLGLPMPLGGTSVYFRRAALEDCDGWDAHNVTEDADLGMRLYRRGWRTRLIDSRTEEEANCRLWPWMRQRSRWLKGFALTWMGHLRRPRSLIGEMGVIGALAFNVLFLGGMVAYLAMPLFWAVLAVGWITGEGVLTDWLTASRAGAGGDGATTAQWLPLAVGASLIAGQAVMAVAAARALWRRGMPGLLIWLPVMPFYWTLGAVASWKAVIELFVAPSYWDKTAHGVSRLPPPRRHTG
ncbi:MAG: glycosyltransferase [Pseudomonadota bacterium]